MLNLFATAFWPWLLALGLIVLAAGRWRRDSLAMWVAGLWALGIALMQVPIQEPWRWLYAAGLWTVVSLVATWHVRAGWAALALWVIPAGYFGLAVGAGPPIIWFAVTEAAGVAALIISSGGMFNDLRDWFVNSRGGRDIPLVAGRGRHRARGSEMPEAPE